MAQNAKPTLSNGKICYLELPTEDVEQSANCGSGIQAAMFLDSINGRSKHSVI